MSSRKILLTLDGSETSLTAVLLAKSIAHLLDMAVHILYVSDEDLTQEELLYLLKLDVKEFPSCIISHKKGDPAEVIIEEAKKAAYLVMCTQGQGYEKTKITGSVTTKVIENTNTPVLLMRPDVVLTRKNEFWCPQHVLIPLNGDPCSSQALTSIMDIITKIDPSLDLLHISFTRKKNHIGPGSLRAPYYEDYPHYEWPLWSREFLRRFCSKSCKKTPDLYVARGEPGEEIVAYAKRNKNDLIVMAWHGKLDSSHAETLRKVIFEAPCPVLLTRIVHKNGH